MEVFGKDLGEGQKFDLATDEHGLITGGVYVPPGEERQVTVIAFDAKGSPIYKGEAVVDIGEELVPEFGLPLTGEELKDPLQARFGSQLLTAGVVSAAEDLVKVQLHPQGSVRQQRAIFTG